MLSRNACPRHRSSKIVNYAKLDVRAADINAQEEWRLGLRSGSGRELVRHDERRIKVANWVRYDRDHTEFEQSRGRHGRDSDWSQPTSEFVANGIAEYFRHVK